MNNQNQEKIWQENPNALWHINLKPKCNICGKIVDSVIEYRVTLDSDPIRACTEDVQPCFIKAMDQLFKSNPKLEFLLSRRLVFKEL